GSKQYIVAVHPHGLAIFSRLFWQTDRCAFLTRKWRIIAANALFYVPVVRELTLLFGAVGASRATFETLLRSGCNVVVYPGGLDEANSITDGSIVTLRLRKGFVRLAVGHGVDILPMFVFGELETLSAVRPLPEVVSKWLQKNFRISTTLFIGRFWLFVPRRVPFDLVVGKPITVTQRDAGAAFDVELEKVYLAYKAEMVLLFEENKQKFGYANRKLVLVES
ncbi:diacylglycerol acyltransferase, partial [Pelagophyceae sp. CCMP2097]